MTSRYSHSREVVAVGGEIASGPEIARVGGFRIKAFPSIGEGGRANVD